MGKYKGKQLLWKDIRLTLCYRGKDKFMIASVCTFKSIGTNFNARGFTKVSRELRGVVGCDIVFVGFIILINSNLLIN
jgi:hypothetical protein